MITFLTPIRGLPKTGETTSYIPGGDGDIESGWDHGQRLTEKTIDGGQVVIDNATGLMWPKDWSGLLGNWGNVVTSWFAAFDMAALPFAGFNDWKIPNANEFMSIFDRERTPLVMPVEFIGVATGGYWTSTTVKLDQTLANNINTDYGLLKKSIKTGGAFYAVAVRSI